MMRHQGSVPVPRGWTGIAAWKGAGASILLHLLVGAAVVVALSGPPKRTPQVVDLTLLPPPDIGRHSLPPAFPPADPVGAAGRAVPPEPPVSSASPTIANPPEMSTSAVPPGPATEKSASVPGSPYPRAAAATSKSQASVPTAGGSAPGTPEGGARAADFVRIRDAIQHAIAYPPAARRMGWEGKVVVAFQLLPDGSVRDVRVVQGSGRTVLDRGAVDAVRNASPFPRSPIEAEVITPVVYRLTTR